MLRVYRLDHFGVDVADLERAERFYTSVLGMSVQMRLPDQVRLRYGDGNFALVLEGRPGSTTAAVSGSATKRSPWSLMAMRLRKVAAYRDWRLGSPEIGSTLMTPPCPPHSGRRRRSLR